MIFSMKSFITYIWWSFMSTLTLKYSVELAFNQDIGWLSPLLAVWSLQFIFSVFALFIVSFVNKK